MNKEDHDRAVLSLRLPPALKLALEQMARRDVRSLNAQIEFYCREGLRREGVDVPEHHQEER